MFFFAESNCDIKQAVVWVTFFHLVSNLEDFGVQRLVSRLRGLLGRESSPRKQLYNKFKQRSCETKTVLFSSCSKIVMSWVTTFLKMLRKLFFFYSISSLVSKLGSRAERVERETDSEVRSCLFAQIYSHSVRSCNGSNTSAVTPLGGKNYW